MAGRDFIVKPTIFSGINNTGEYILTSHVRPKMVNEAVNGSAVVEGYSPISYDQTPQIQIKDNKIIPRGNPLLYDPNYYPNYNWAKTKYNMLYTEATGYTPLKATSAIGNSQVNAEVFDNYDLVSISGVSSTIRVQFSKRPGVVQQFVYEIPNFTTSAYVMWRPGSDTGSMFGYNERHFEFSGGKVPEAGIYNPSPALIGDYKASTCHHHNPTRGGATTLFRPNTIWAPDATWPTSVTTYRNYYTGTCSNGITSGEFKSCVIPFDFIAYSGESPGYTSQEKLGNEFNQALWKNMRMYENFTVNFSGIEGAILHEMWSYNDKSPSTSYIVGDITATEASMLKNLMTTQFDLCIGHLFDKAYTYNPIRNELYNIDNVVSGGHASSVNSPYQSTTVSAMFMPLYTSQLSEINEYPVVYEYESKPAERFYPTYIWNGGTRTPLTLEDPPIVDNNILTVGSQWCTMMFKPHPNQRNVSGINYDLYPVYYRNPSYGLNLVDGTTGTYYPANTPWNKGTLFFNWQEFRVATKYYMSGTVYKNQAWLDTAKYYFDRSLYYCVILEKSANNFVTNYKGGVRPYVASGPMCVGILAKGDVNPENYDFFNATGIIYKGNALDGEWNSMTFGPRKWTYQYAIDQGMYDSSSDGGCEMPNHHINFIKLGKTDYYTRKKGWIKSRYFMIVGKDKDDVKAKIDKIISSNILNTPQGMDKIPQYILDSAPKKSYE